MFAALALSLGLAAAIGDEPAPAASPPSDGATASEPPAIPERPDAPSSGTPAAPPGDGTKKPPAPDLRPERNDFGLLVPVAQCCAGTVVAWLPIPCVTSAAAGYVVTAAGNGTSPRDDAALGPMLGGVITDVVVIGLIAGGYGLAFAGAASGNPAGAIAGTLGGVVLIGGAFFARPFAVAGVSTIVWQLQAEERGGEAWLPPPVFTPDDADKPVASPAAGVPAR